jgi:hypothetical protein
MSSWASYDDDQNNETPMLFDKMISTSPPSEGSSLATANSASNTSQQPKQHEKRPQRPSSQAQTARQQSDVRDTRAQHSHDARKQSDPRGIAANKQRPPRTRDDVKPVATPTPTRSATTESTVSTPKTSNNPWTANPSSQTTSSPTPVVAPTPVAASPPSSGPKREKKPDLPRYRRGEHLPLQSITPSSRVSASKEDARGANVAASDDGVAFPVDEPAIVGKCETMEKPYIRLTRVRCMRARACVH